jgi:hypothetical protein
MPRLPYGARTFTEQVKALRKSAKYEAGEPDGLDVSRTITFDKATSKWLEPILDHLEDDRIVGSHWHKDQLTVEFSTQSSVADQKNPYPLEAAAEVAADAAKS